MHCGNCNHDAPLETYWHHSGLTNPVDGSPLCPPCPGCPSCRARRAQRPADSTDQE